MWLNTIFVGAFRLYDVDNDGFITREEMYNIVDAIYQMVVRMQFVGRNNNVCEEFKLTQNIFFIGSAATGRRRKYAAEAGGQDIRSDGQEPRRPAHLGGVPRGQQGGSANRAGAESRR